MATAAIQPKPDDRVKALPWDWTGRTAIICASGPSFTEEQAEKVIAHQANGTMVCTVNDAYRRIPDPDLMYACDMRWWQFHCTRGTLGDPKHDGKKVSGHPSQIPNHLGVIRVPGRGNGMRERRGQQAWWRKPPTVVWAGSSGFQALNLVLHLAADPIILVGFDCKVDDKEQPHFFGKHPGGFSNPTAGSMNALRMHFNNAAEEWPEARERIRNATPGSAITCFDTVEL